MKGSSSTGTGTSRRRGCRANSRQATQTFEQPQLRLRGCLATGGRTAATAIAAATTTRKPLQRQRRGPEQRLRGALARVLPLLLIHPWRLRWRCALTSTATVKCLPPASVSVCPSTPHARSQHTRLLGTWLRRRRTGALSFRRRCLVGRAHALCSTATCTAAARGRV